MEIKVDDKIIMVISEEDKIYLKSYLAGDEGIMNWIIDAIVGKINNRKYWFFKEWQKKLIDDPDVETVPANEDDLRDMVIVRPDYKDGIQRDKEQAEEIEAEIARAKAKEAEELIDN